MSTIINSKTTTPFLCDSRMPNLRSYKETLWICPYCFLHLTPKSKVTRTRHLLSHGSIDLTSDINYGLILAADHNATFYHYIDVNYNDIKYNLPLFLSFLRRTHKRTSQYVATHSNHTEFEIIQFEDGSKHPSISSLIRICNVMNTHLVMDTQL